MILQSIFFSWRPGDGLFLDYKRLLPKLSGKRKFSPKSFQSVQKGQVLYHFHNKLFFAFFFASVGALVRGVPGASIGYRKHLLSLKVMMPKAEQGPWSFPGVCESMVKYFV